MILRTETNLAPLLNLYTNVLQCYASNTATDGANTYFLSGNSNAAARISGSATGGTVPPVLYYIQAADFPTVQGLPPKMRVTAQMFVNDTAPTKSWVFGLYPVTTPATSGAAGVRIYTAGTVVAGSTVTFTTPAADSMSIGMSADFAVPADGWYAIGFTLDGTLPANNFQNLQAFLQCRNAS